MNKEQKIKHRLYANSILRQLKKSHTYESLSNLLGIPVTDLARYVKGHVLPSAERVQIIVDEYNEILKTEVQNSVTVDSQGHFNHLPLLYNTNLLKHIASYIVSQFEELEFDKILSTSTDGLPIAYAVGFELGIDVVYAKKKKEIGLTDFIEQQIFIGAYSYSLFIPKGALGKKDRVLIIDDAIRSQITSRSLIKLCKKAGAEPCGMFVLISVNKGVTMLKNEVAFPVKHLLEL